MTKYKIKLNTGLEISFENHGLDVKELVQGFNTNDLLFTSIGGSFLNKHSIVYVAPEIEDKEECDYKVSLNNQDVLDLNLEEEDFSEVDFVEKLNSPGNYFITFGGAIFQKHMLNTLIKVK